MSKQIKIKPIKGYSAFSKIYKIAHKKRSNKLFIAFTYSEEDSQTLFLGVSSPKKQTKKAVGRNRAKRLLKESVRQINKEDNSLLSSFNQIILVWQEPVLSPSLLRLNDVKNEVKNLLNRALIKKDEIHIN